MTTYYVWMSTCSNWPCETVHEALTLAALKPSFSSDMSLEWIRKTNSLRKQVHTSALQVLCLLKFTEFCVFFLWIQSCETTATPARSAKSASRCTASTASRDTSPAPGAPGAVLPGDAQSRHRSKALPVLQNIYTARDLWLVKTSLLP